MTRAPADALEIFLQPGEFYFGDGTTRIRTLLGSCVAVTFWHARLRAGGMSHCMLPERPRAAKGAPLDGRYVDDAMLLAVGEIVRAGTRPAEYQVKIFCGGRMFATAKPGRIDIAQRNVEAARALVRRHGFHAGAEDLGGEGHRNVILDLWSGDVWMKRALRAGQA
jgi:chemotaxis protein CheD